MNFDLPALRREEIVVLKLRALFEKNGYRLFRMGSFEEYDLYMQNKPFLMGDDVISFTGADGRLMALKPDVTLSIVRNTPAGDERRVYYSENVYRRDRHTGDYREIPQVGLECISGAAGLAESKVLCLAAESLAIIGEASLDLSHMEFTGAMLAPLGDNGLRQRALAALRAKSPHEMRGVAEAAGLDATRADRLAALAGLSGPFGETLEKARLISEGVPGTARPLDGLLALGNIIEQGGVTLRLDFSILNDADYYGGLVFQGFVRGVPRPVLAGGRYDGLLRRFDKPQGAVGFGLYLDALAEGDAEKNGFAASDWLNVALPKGRLGDQVYRRFEKAGLSCAGLQDKGRKLIFEDEATRVRYYLVKPTDVQIYVEHGVADIGVVGRDVLLESGADVLELLDLGLGKCRLAVAGRAGFDEDPARPLRVATKYPNVARHYYAGKSRAVELILLSGSIELAPLIGLTDVIVDIVETGSTLKENDLAVLEEIVPSSARLIANRASYRFKNAMIQDLLEKLQNLT